MGSSKERHQAKKNKINKEEHLDKRGQGLPASPGGLWYSQLRIYLSLNKEGLEQIPEAFVVCCIMNGCLDW